MVLNHAGCMKSVMISMNKTEDLTGQRFGKLLVLKRAEEIGRNWICKCDCGNTCIVNAKLLKNKHTQSCGCLGSSVGEYNIESLLQDNKIQYIKEFIFSNLPNRRYDFYLPQFNRLIEFDGPQHEGKIGGYYTKEKVEALMLRDREKNQYALSHNIPLVRIPYYKRDNITLGMILGDKYLIQEA